MFKQIYFKKVLIIFFSLFFFQEVCAEVIFLSLKKNQVNVRYGPSFESPIKYIYKKIDLPIKQIDKKENWRRIVDFKNNSGWIHWSQLKSVNSIISLNDKLMFNKPTIFSKPLAKIKRGRVLTVQKCINQWCKVKTEKFSGWIKNNKVWGKIN